MTLLTTLLEKPIKAFKDLKFVYHYFKPAKVKAPYAVWLEHTDDSFNADNEKAERVLNGIIDYYTQTENDSNLDLIEGAMNSMSSSWSLVAVQYEEDTMLIHFSWEWSVENGKAEN